MYSYAEVLIKYKVMKNVINRYSEEVVAKEINIETLYIETDKTSKKLSKIRWLKGKNNNLNQ